jgi:hypothetical protein
MVFDKDDQARLVASLGEGDEQAMQTLVDERFPISGIDRNRRVRIHV